MCDLAYVIRAEQIRQTALAEMQLMPHAEEGQQFVTPDQAVDDYHDWLYARPPELDQNDDEAELLTLMGVR